MNDQSDHRHIFYFLQRKSSKQDVGQVGCHFMQLKCDKTDNKTIEIMVKVAKGHSLELGVVKPRPWISGGLWRVVPSQAGKLSQHQPIFRSRERRTWDMSWNHDCRRAGNRADCCGRVS